MGKLKIKNKTFNEIDVIANLISLVLVDVLKLDLFLYLKTSRNVIIVDKIMIKNGTIVVFTKSI